MRVRGPQTFSALDERATSRRKGGNVESDITNRGERAEKPERGRLAVRARGFRRESQKTIWKDVIGFFRPRHNCRNSKTGVTGEKRHNS